MQITIMVFLYQNQGKQSGLLKNIQVYYKLTIVFFIYYRAPLAGEETFQGVKAFLNSIKG